MKREASEHAARVVIIGGGPAGCATALTLVRLGVSASEIVIVESKAFPRAKVCGEFVTPRATATLERLVEPSALVACGARRVQELVILEGSRERRWRMPEAGWTLSRRTLDAVLTERCVNAGVRVLQPSRVAGVEYAVDGVRVRIDGGEEIAAACVVHADGSGRHDPRGAVAARRGVVGLKCHLRGPAGDGALYMRSATGAYAGLVRVERDGGEEGASAARHRFTCAMVVRSEVVRACGGDEDAVLERVWPGIRSELGLTREGPWMACPVPGSRVVRGGHARSVRVGNAGVGIEPVGGEGIGCALWSGERCGELLAACDWSERSVRRAGDALARDLRARVRVTRPSCRLAAFVLERPGLVRAIWPVLAWPGVVLGPWYRATGKPA